MLSFVLMTQKCVLAAFCCFFVYMFGTSLRGLPHLHPSYMPLHHRPSNDIHVQVANATASELRALLQKLPELGDFGAMGDRVSRFADLAGAVTKNPMVDQRPFISLLRDYFPWWQPLPTTYVPWEHHPIESVGETGLVICSGSSNLISTIHLIRSLRHVLNSTLPIQVAYAGDEDLSFHDRRVLTDLGPNIEALNLLDYFDNGMSGLVGEPWAIKPFALLASRFKKAMVVGADTIFLRAPDELFNDQPGLRETGTLFWHDRAFVFKNRPDRHDWVHSIMEGREPSPMLNRSLFWTHGVYDEMDSGVVCMDKGRPNVFMSLLFTCWMNTVQVRKEITYKHVRGDKDTFWLASELSSSNYSFHPSYAGTIGTASPIFGDPKPAEPLTPFRSPLFHPDPPSHLLPPKTPSKKQPNHDPLDLKPRLGTSAPREVTHHNIPPSHPRPVPMHICSTHALHLDHLDRPLWFSGTLRRDRSRGDSVEMDTFTHVRFGGKEWNGSESEGAWKMGRVPCLRVGEMRDVDGELGRVLGGLVREGRGVDWDVLGVREG